MGNCYACVPYSYGTALCICYSTGRGENKEVNMAIRINSSYPPCMRRADHRSDIGLWCTDIYAKLRELDPDAKTVRKIRVLCNVYLGSAFDDTKRLAEKAFPFAVTLLKRFKNLSRFLNSDGTLEF
ncbi:MAG: hypothetical protein ACYCOU_01390 [Sulfobacillus sp.]